MINKTFSDIVNRIGINSDDSILYLLFRVGVLNEDYTVESLSEKDRNKIALFLLEDDKLKVPIFSDEQLQKVLPKGVKKIEPAKLKEFRLIFKGIRAGSEGSKSGVETKLLKWFKHNPQYSIEDVIKAAKKYKNDCKRSSGLNYMKSCQNFVWYKTLDDSMLSTYIESSTDLTDDIDLFSKHNLDDV